MSAFFLRDSYFCYRNFVSKQPVIEISKRRCLCGARIRGSFFPPPPLPRVELSARVQVCQQKTCLNPQPHPIQTHISRVLICNSLRSKTSCISELMTSSCYDTIRICIRLPKSNVCDRINQNHRDQMYNGISTYLFCVNICP